jgi:hypothetical protein
MHLFVLFTILLVGSAWADAPSLPSCDSEDLTRSGNTLTVTMPALTRIINQRLANVHSHFSDLELTPADGNHVKVSGKKDGTPMAISGPVKANKNGEMVLHADHITKNGSGEMILMDLFGKSLSDYLHLQKMKNLKTHDNDLMVNPDGLLNIRGHLDKLNVEGNKIEMQFASQPCR